MTPQQKLLAELTRRYTTNGRYDGVIEKGVDEEKVRKFFDRIGEIGGYYRPNIHEGNFRSLPLRLLDHYSFFTDLMIAAPYAPEKEVRELLDATDFKYEILDFHIWNSSVTGFVVYYGKNDPRYQLKRRYNRGFGWEYNLVRAEETK